ncbi:RNA polymerase sigma-70 factor [Mucilaginibacter sp. BJC16-A38]|uniref:RNA polymerase sigma factor n=1 Tax=Mucilaginibacter phenanthrenivorans TaxID=1234842 RepID=UPI00215778F1|nr:RNA polymerase sigma-70 factor [Mucilaginibacter phenanthrenivorans]MCR8559789.1 RNA polymerase sigma-70 factor [Mucilaginibacter phenanthrenivorans]
MSNKPIDGNSIKQLIEGNEDVFTSLYESYSEKVYRLAFRFLKDKALSEEVVQETFINVWLSREKLDPEGNMWLYLYVVAKRLALNSLRQACKSNDFVENLLNFMEEQNSTEEEVLARDLENFTGKIIEKLPRQQQLVFKLSRVEGLSYKEIAEQLNISPNTVKNHMVEALKTLRSQLRYSDIIYCIVLAYLI